mgnify:CR=1 FL=1
MVGAIRNFEVSTATALLQPSAVRFVKSAKYGNAVANVGLQPARSGEEGADFGTELVLRKPPLSAFGQTTRLPLPTRQTRNAPQTSGGCQPPILATSPAPSPAFLNSSELIRRQSHSALLYSGAETDVSVSLFLLARVDKCRLTPHGSVNSLESDICRHSL